MTNEIRTTTLSHTINLSLYFSIFLFLNRSFDLKRFVILTFGRIYDSLELAFRFNTVGA